MSFTTPQYVPPPGSSLSSYIHTALHTSQPASIPKGFLDAMAVREPVYITEQNCSLENEVDDDDPRSHHWNIYQTPPQTSLSNPPPGQQKPVATIRLVPPPHEAPHGPNPLKPSEPYVKLGRLATLKEARGKGLARQLVQAALDWAKEHPREVVGAKEGEEAWAGLVLVHAQAGTAEKMWEKMGFVADEGMGRWDEEGIEHMGMWLRVTM